MPFENQILTFSEWFWGHPFSFSPFQPKTWGELGFFFGTLVIVFFVSLIVSFLWYLIAAMQHGPSEGFYLVAKAIFGSFTDDLPRFSPRRTLAIARLAVQEAIRNKVLIGFGLFILILLFAGLFFDIGTTENPAKVYLNFVLSTTNFLVLLMALFLSVFSLPNDIKNRTIYTVVTKPVRSGEIVLGRILGFAGVSTLMLVGMGLISYLFVVRGMAHSHDYKEKNIVKVSDSKSQAERWEAQTSFDSHHRHKIYLSGTGENKKAYTDVQHGHRHEVTVTGEGENAQFTLGKPQGDLIARVPQFGRLLIYDRKGEVGEGINVGNEWNYRGYIGGGNTKAGASWKFTNVTKERFPDGLPLELTLSVFRTYKGDIERGVLGEYVVRNPDKNAKIKTSPPKIFESQEYSAQSIRIPTSWDSAKDANGNVQKIDLFKDLVDKDGNVEIYIRCAEANQFFGVAQADVYLRPKDSYFIVNFIKGYLSIWLQMLLVTSFGVTFSTFLTGPVAMLATFSGIILGFFGEFVRDISTGTLEGGGPLESAIRLFTQQNVMTDLEAKGAVVQAIKFADTIVMALMHAGTYILPNFRSFSTSSFVANGYDIYPALMYQHCTMTLVYFIGVTTVGYFFLKTREIAG